MITKTKHTISHYLFTALETIIKGIIGSMIWLLLGAGGLLIFQTRKAPFDFIFGIPLMGIGFGLSVNSLWTILLSIFSLQYNKGVCRFCTPV